MESLAPLSKPKCSENRSRIPPWPSSDLLDSAYYTFTMALRLFAATTSQGKLRDFRTAAAAHSISIEALPNLESIPAPEENGATFADNATLKAVYYSRLAPGQLVLADAGALVHVLCRLRPVARHHGGDHGSAAGPRGRMA